LQLGVRFLTVICCFFTYRSVEQRSTGTDSLSGLVDETLAHLSSHHLSYYVNWCLMLDLEKQMDQSKNTVADIWCKGSEARYG